MNEIDIQQASKVVPIKNEMLANYDEKTRELIAEARHRGILDEAMPSVQECIAKVLAKRPAVDPADVVILVMDREDAWVPEELRQQILRLGLEIYVMSVERAPLAESFQTWTDPAYEQKLRDRLPAVRQPYRSVGLKMAERPPADAMWLAVISWGAPSLRVASLKPEDAAAAQAEDENRAKLRAEYEAKAAAEEKARLVPPPPPPPPAAQLELPAAEAPAKPA